MAAGESFLVLRKSGIVHKILDQREDAIRSAQMVARELKEEVQLYRRIGTVTVDVSVEFKLG